MTFQLKSTAFSPGTPMPRIYSKDGSDASPPLAWSNGPEGTQEYVLVCLDPDAPTPSPWVHWLLYGIAPTIATLPSGIPTDATLASLAGARQGLNSYGDIGYGGPQPPRGDAPHHYVFTLYALDTKLAAGPGATKDELMSAMRGHILGSAQVVGTYQRAAGKTA